MSNSNTLPPLEPDKEKFWAFHQKEIDEKMALELEY